MEAVTTFRPTQFDVAKGDVRMSGTIVDVDPKTGKALSVQRIQINEEEAEKLVREAG